jgi:gluconolactonase
LTPPVEVLASGFHAVEGPTVHPDGNVYFSDPNGGGVYRLTPARDVELVVPKRRGAAGIAAHADSGVIVSGRDLTRVVDGESTVLVAREDVPAPEGLRAIGFNDIVADVWGNVLAGCHFGDATDGTHRSSCLLYVAPGAAPVIAYDDVVFSNGIAHDKDATWLYHSDTFGYRVIVSRLDPDGPPVRESEFPADRGHGHPDGMAVDDDGLVWVAMPGAGGIGRFRRDGELDTWLELPTPRPLSLCFAGDDTGGIYVTTMGWDIDKDELAPGNGELWHVDIPYRGAPVGLARI